MLSRRRSLAPEHETLRSAVSMRGIRDGLRLLPAAKIRPDILPAMQHAYDQHAVGLRLVKHDMAAIHDAAKAFGPQIFTGNACERIIGQGSEALLQPAEIELRLRSTPCAPRVAVNLLQVLV